MFSSSPEELQRSSERVIGIGYYLLKTICVARETLGICFALARAPTFSVRRSDEGRLLNCSAGAEKCLSILFHPSLSTPSRNSDPQMGFPIGSGVIAISIEQKFHRHVGSDLIWL